jgi:hypothetical protein
MEESLNYEVNIKKGKWKHFKGGVYESVDVAFNSEDLSPMVLYRSLETGKLWVRPIKEFFGIVNTEEYNGPRFIEEK